MRRIVLGALWLAAARGLGPLPAAAQAPTIHAPPSAPGSMTSSLGPTPGAGASPFGLNPGMDEMLLGGGRVGTAFPRVPSSIATPGQYLAGRERIGGITSPTRLPIAPVPVYGPLALPDAAEDEGPADGLTLDQALDRLLRANLDLRAQSFELPMARVVALTAGLRANPFLYADSQLVPYGRSTRDRPVGPTQYDVNLTHPFDVSGKRQARTLVAERAATVLEAQYQDAVRLQVDNLYTAFVAVLAARETIRFAKAAVDGLARVQKVTEVLYQRADATRADVGRITIQSATAELGLDEARERLRAAKRTLGALLNVPPDQAEALELRGSLADKGDVPSGPEALIRIALDARPDLVAQRLGIHRAEADVKLARADWLGDVYVLYQPYTLQNNVPYGLKSPTSWALGLTAPVPVYNRNQGGVERARLNVAQTQLEAAGRDRAVVTEVAAAWREYRMTRDALRRTERDVLPTARQMRNDALRLFTTGEHDAFAFYNAQGDYNEAIRRYRELLIRHRRSMLALNTAVGVRVLP